MLIASGSGEITRSTLWCSSLAAPIIEVFTALSVTSSIRETYRDGIVWSGVIISKTVAILCKLCHDIPVECVASTLLIVTSFMADGLNGTLTHGSLLLESI